MIFDPQAPSPILTMVGIQLFLYPLPSQGFFNLSGLTYKVGIIAVPPRRLWGPPIASEHGLDEDLAAALIIITTPLVWHDSVNVEPGAYTEYSFLDEPVEEMFGKADESPIMMAPKQ